MRPRLLTTLLTVTGVSALAISAAEAFTPHDTTHDLEFPLLFEAIPERILTERLDDASISRSTLGENWFVRKSRRTGHVQFAYGGDVSLANGLASEAAAIGAARSFLLENSDLLGVRENNMELIDATNALGKWAVHFQQKVQGVPVFRGTAFVLMGESGRVAAFGSDFFPEAGELPPATISDAEALGIAAASIGATVRDDRPTESVLWLVPAPQGELMALTPAYRTVFESNEPFGRWATFVDARSGEILGRRNFYHRVNVIGNVNGDVQNLPPSYGWCDGSQIDPTPNLAVNVSGGNSDDTDGNGDFDIPHGGTSPVTITAELRGPYSNVNRFSGLGPDANVSQSATPGAPAQITWNDANSRQDERSTFWHANRVHDFMTDLDANFTELDYSMPSVIGRTDGFCPGNAWWDGVGMNYCEESVSADRANTGELGNVIYHEFGHGVTQEVYLKHGSPEPVGDMHEGNSDVIANFLDRNSVIGLGFFLSSCTGGIRDADNGLQWPQDNNGGHFGGQIIAGFHWDAWQSLLAAESQAVADSIAFNTWHYARDLGRPQNQPSQVLWTFMMDDDDANLDNGTPNYDHFCLGALNHGFECPEILTGVVIQHTKLHHQLNTGTGGLDVVATITSTETLLDPSTLRVRYRFGGAGPFTGELMTPTGNPDEYSATIPIGLTDREVEYFIRAADLNSNTRTHPPLAPSSTHKFDVVSVYEDLESGGVGWTVGAPGDNATTGVWELIDPIGTQAQPENDVTPDPGTMAFVTGQCAGPNCSSGCSLGCNDVDNGSTTLLSPVYDLAGTNDVLIKYERWYSNNTGADPNNDFWVVDVSNDAGATWTNVENTNVTSAGWETRSIDVDALFGNPGLVQVRFRASDLGSGSLVEAAVDELRILKSPVDVNDPTDAPDLAASAVRTLSLEQSQPNPFRGETSIRYAIPNPGKVELTVYNVRGQEVRTLVDAVVPAGRYDVRWDGRDAAGQAVSSGVYFYRLTAGDEVRTKRATVMK